MEKTIPLEPRVPAKECEADLGIGYLSCVIVRQA